MEEMLAPKIDKNSVEPLENVGLGDKAKEADTKHLHKVDMPIYHRGEVLHNKYKIVKLLNQGGFGQVFLAQLMNSKQYVAIKAESSVGKVSVVANERRVHETINNNPHGNFLEYFGEGKTDLARYLVMQLCGPNLRELKKKIRAEKLTPECSLAIAVQMMESIKHLHNIGFIHRDIKPANFCMGIPGMSNEHTLYMLDFGLTKRHLTLDASPVAFRPGHRGFRGTPRYASIGILQGCDMGRVDDMWSMFYIVLEQSSGTLPWRAVTDRDKVLHMKLTTDMGILLADCPPSFTTLYNHVTSLQYETTPDYDALLSHMKTDLSNLIGDTQPRLDWIQYS